MMSPDERKRLSKYLSLVLRHQPEKLNLTLDEQGYVGLQELLAAMSQERYWRNVSEEQILEVVETSDKQRFEVSGNRIRARYGHSVAEAVTHPEVLPPEILYHGTSPTAVPSILAEGLKPMNRQYVHLSTEVEQARQVGRRHHSQPVILTVKAQQAWEGGVKFHRPEDRLYLSDTIPPEFIEA